MIRLLNVKTLTIHQFKDDDCPPYAILSHRWAEDPANEVVYNDMAQFHVLCQDPLSAKATSAAKLMGACQRVLEDTEDEIEYLWVDTVCIKQDNPMELSTAINSMYRLYSDAEVCLVYLLDYPSPEIQTIGQSDWFNRGWTLQELVAPEVVKFFDRDWRYLGSRGDLAEEIMLRTGIRKLCMIAVASVKDASISERMSWMAGRTTTVPEDTAYCLLGLFDVNMPLLYGEGKERAFLRLQEEIMRYSDDHTLFAWKEDYPVHHRPSTIGGLLAHSPDCFRSTGGYKHVHNEDDHEPYQMTNKGVSITFRLQDAINNPGLYIAALNCTGQRREPIGIYLRHIGQSRFVRVRANDVPKLQNNHLGRLMRIYVQPIRHSAKAHHKWVVKEGRGMAPSATVRQDMTRYPFGLYNAPHHDQPSASSSSSSSPTI
ncbi:MAG: hypothetical protein Q9169_008057 [Polycauliona sp. 2 TL-2023]